MLQAAKQSDEKIPETSLEASEFNAIPSLMSHVFQRDKNTLKMGVMLLATPVNIKLYCRSTASLIFKMLY